MKIKSALITSASGSIGGLTASHNRGGLYFRARTIPTNPGSQYQVTVRGFLAQLATAWTDSLTPAQRAAWDVYADRVPVPDTLGEPRNIGGLAHYVRSNVPRLQAELARIDDAPVIFTLATWFYLAVDTFTSATGDFAVNFSAADDWVNEDDAALYVLGSRPTNPSINYFKGPYRFAAKIEGDSVTPPTSPVTVVNPFPFAVGNQIFVQCRVQRADGRLSTPFRGFGVGV